MVGFGFRGVSCTLIIFQPVVCRSSGLREMFWERKRTTALSHTPQKGAMGTVKSWRGYFSFPIPHFAPHLTKIGSKPIAFSISSSSYTRRITQADLNSCVSELTCPGTSSETWGPQKKAPHPEPVPRFLPRRSGARRCFCISPRLFLRGVKGKGARNRGVEALFQTLLTNFLALTEREGMTDHRTFR